MDKPHIQSYLWHDEDCFMVSTMNRGSSSPLAYGATYAETLVWEFDWDKRERGALVWQDEGPTGSISKHIAICGALYKGGIYALTKEQP